MMKRRRSPFSPTAKPLERIGFFHFGSDKKEDPIASLRSALLTKDRKDLTNSLVVIPEAFNLRGGYFGENRQADPRISGWLALMSIEFGITFVAGLIEPSGANSAYLIDGRTQKLLSRKIQDDRTRNYQPSSVNYDAIIHHRGLCLSALICMDAVFPRVTPNERHQSLLSRFRAARSVAPVLCIPAYMGSFSSVAIVQAWPSEITTVLSNSSATHPSLTRIGETLISIKPEENWQNVIYLTNFPPTSRPESPKA